MLTKKEIKKAIDALSEIEHQFKQSLEKDGIQKEDFEQPFAVIVQNGQVIYKTFNPLQNGVYLGNEKLQLNWDINFNSDFKIDMIQKFENDDIKLVFSLDGNIINALESKPGEKSLNATLQLKINL